MSTGDQLVSISLDDLPSLINAYEKVNKPYATLDILYNLRIYQRWLKDTTSPKFVHLDVLTLNNEWSSDGLCLLVISNALFINSIVDCPARLSTVLKLASKYTIALTFPGQMGLIESHLRDEGLWKEYEFLPHDHYFLSVEQGLQVTYTIPDNIILRQLTAENVAEVDDHLPYKSPTTYGYIRQMIEYMPSIGAFDRDTGELKAWLLSYMNESHSALTVKPQYRGTGLAKLLSKKMVRDRALADKPSHCHIRCGNVASERLFQGLGFECHGQVLFGSRNGVCI